MKLKIVLIVALLISVASATYQLPETNMGGILHMGNYKVSNMSPGVTMYDATNMNQLWTKFNKTGDTVSGYAALNTANFAGAVTGASTAKFGGAITGASLTSNASVGAVTESISGYSALNVLNVAEAMTTTSTAKIGGTATVNALVNNGTLTQTGVVTLANDTKLGFGNTSPTGAQYIRYVSAGNYLDIGGTPLMTNGFGWTGTAAPTSGSDLVAAGGESDLDYSLSTGMFKTPQGVATMTNGGTVPTGKTWAIVDADKLTEGGKIVPVTIELVNMELNNQTKNGTIFNAYEKVMVDKISETHEAAASGFGNCSAYVMKLTNTDGAANGDYMANVSPSLRGTANTMQNATMSPIAWNTTLNPGDRIGLVINNNLNAKITGLSGGRLTIWGHRIT